MNAESAESVAAARRAYERALRALAVAEEAYDAALGYPASPPRDPEGAR